MRRTKAESAKTRAAIIDAALPVFLANGYSATTLDQVCAQAGVTRGAIYWHFPEGKPELFSTLIREKSAAVTTSFKQPAETGDSPITQLRNILTKWLDLLETNIEYRQIMELTAFKVERTAELESGIAEKIVSIRGMQAMFAQMLQEAVQKGEAKPDLNCTQASLACLSLLWGLAEIWLLDPKAFSISTQAGPLVDVFFNGIVAK